MELRPEQAEALSAIQTLAGMQGMLIIRWPTGRGKSYPILLAAQSGIRIVVIAPLVALVDQWVKAFNAMEGIKAYAYHSKVPSYMQKERDDAIKDLTLPIAIVTTPESLLIHSQILRWCQLVCADEVHYACDWMPESRMRYATALRMTGEYEKPIVAMSATLRRSEYYELAELAGHTERYGALEASTILPALTIEKIRGLTPESALKAVLSHPGASKVIAFGDTVKDVEGVAESVPGSVAYHSQLKGSVKRERLESFRSGDLQCLVTTTSLSAGLDTPCTDVVALYLAGSLEAQIQELGRATRGKAGRGWIVYHVNTAKRAFRTALNKVPTIQMCMDAIQALKDHGEVWTAGHQALMPDVQWQSIAATIDTLIRSGAIDEMPNGLMLNPGSVDRNKIERMVNKAMRDRVASWQALNEWLDSNDDSAVERYFNDRNVWEY